MAKFALTVAVPAFVAPVLVAALALVPADRQAFVALASVVVAVVDS